MADADGSLSSLRGFGESSRGLSDSSIVLASLTHGGSPHRHKVHLGSDPNAAPNGTDTARALSRGLLPYCASAGASLGSGLGAGLAAGSAAGGSATGLAGVAAGAAAGVSAIGLRATVRFGAARFRLIALARPRVGFLAPADLPRRAAVVRRAAAALRFVADPRFPAFLVLVVFAFDFRAVLAITSPLWCDDSLFFHI